MNISNTPCQAANIGFQFAGAVRAFSNEDDREEKDEDILEALQMQIDGLRAASLACKISSPIGAVHVVTQIGASISDVLDSFTPSDASSMHATRQLQASLVAARTLLGWLEDYFHIDGSAEVATDYCISRL